MTNRPPLVVAVVGGRCATVRVMALLSQMFRTVAITGRTDTINAWFASRQGGRWAEQTVRNAFPRVQPAAATRPPADPDRTHRELMELHARGVLTDAELKNFRTAAGLNQPAAG
jgi:hypothetical protein